MKNIVAYVPLGRPDFGPLVTFTTFIKCWLWQVVHMTTGVAVVGARADEEAIVRNELA